MMLKQLCLEKRKQFLKDDIIGKVDENTAMFKATITDPVKMGEVMSVRMEEIGPKLGLTQGNFEKVYKVNNCL